MKAAIDLRYITPGSSGGIVPHLQNVLAAAFRLAPRDEFVVYTTCFNHDLLAPYPPNARQVTLSPVTYYADLARECEREAVDVLFRAFPEDVVCDFPMRKQVFFIPDLQHESLPECFDADTLRKRRRAFNRALSLAGAVGTCSAFSLRTLREHPWTSVSDLFICSPALTQAGADAPLSAEERAALPASPYFYFPANLWPHKNHRRVLQAFARFLQTGGVQAELVLSGHPAGWEELRADFPGLPVRHVGYVSRAMVRALYENALALLFFTLYEGFGMPVLEAFDAGTPVLCSNTTSLPETGGDAVLSCDPTDVAAMAALIGRVYAEAELRADLRARGKSQLGRYQWDDSACELLAALRRVAAGALPLVIPEQPLVTIVTPSYNQAVFLRRTIESVLAQTYPNIEYIVMDGGSTDGSREILAEYGERFAWQSARDGGQANAVNKGLALARGNILAYLNSDDTLLPDAVERAVAYFAAHPECDLVYGKAYYIDVDDAVTGEYRTTPYYYERLVADNQICQPAAFWQRRIGDLVGPFDETLRTALDHDYWIRIDRAGGILQHLEEYLANSRMYMENKTMSLRETVFAEIFRVTRKHAGYVSHIYYIGLWDHWVKEKRQGWKRFLRYVPNGSHAAAMIHHRLDHGGLRKWLEPLRPAALSWHVSQWLLRTFPVLRAPVYLYTARRAMVGPNRPFLGYHADGHLASIVQLYLSHRPARNPGYIEGYALLDCRVEIVLIGAPNVTRDLKAGEVVRLDIPPLADAFVRLKFSRWETDAKGRRRAFYLTGTNLFAEWQAFL
jgi:glycosyltransferase involved in cell wall biosynthesis